MVPISYDPRAEVKCVDIESIVEHFQQDRQISITVVK